MSKAVPSIATTLCERCGYVIDDLDQQPNCPECGLPIEDSQPFNRRGTCWQRDPSVRSLARLAVDIHKRPLEVFRQLHAGRDSDRDLLWLGSLLPMLPLVPIVAILLNTRWAMPVSIALGISVLMLVGAFAVNVLLSLIELRGVVFFSAKRGWRVPRELALAIIAHCTPCWVWAWIGAILGAIVGPAIEAQIASFVANTLFVFIIPTAPPLLGFVLGMLVFESIVYLGVRACKHANAFRNARYA